MYVAWVLNVSAKCLHFRFEFAEGQNTKIHAKYQNSFQAQNAKISAVSTPILTGKAAFFSIFRALSEKSVENDWKSQKTQKKFCTKNLNSEIWEKKWKIFIKDQGSRIKDQWSFENALDLENEASSAPTHEQNISILRVYMGKREKL